MAIGASMDTLLIVPMASSLTQPVASPLINDITGKGQDGRFLPSLVLSLMMKVLGKGVTWARKRVTRAGKLYSVNHMDKIFYFCSVP